MAVHPLKTAEFDSTAEAASLALADFQAGWRA